MSTFSSRIILLFLLILLVTVNFVCSETWTANCNSLQFSFDRTNQVTILSFNTENGFMQMAKGIIDYDDGSILRSALNGNDVGYNGLSLTEIELNSSQGAVNIQYRNPSNGFISYSLFCRTTINGGPSTNPSNKPSKRPSRKPSQRRPTTNPSKRPSRKPSRKPSQRRPTSPTRKPSRRPTRKPTSRRPTKKPTKRPTRKPTPRHPTKKPTKRPTRKPTPRRPSKKPTKRPTKIPTKRPLLSLSPTIQSTESFSSYYFSTSENPTVLSYFVNPITGSDTNNNGTTLSSPFRTVGAAWGRIPQGTLNTGYVINLAPGNYTEYDHFPSYWESRYGTYTKPIIIQGPKSAVFKGHVNIYDCKYLYLLNFTINTLGDVIHCEKCEYLLIRNMDLIGGANTWENVKINQANHIYLERNRIHRAGDNAVDFVAVQYGHIVGNEIANLGSTQGDWCMYVKGGSSYLRIEGNRIHHCGTGGFTAGQGTGFEFMVAPWLHYEAYDIKFFNNIVHDVDGAAIGINGGYNIMLAYNSAYRVGQRSHVIEVVFGSRTCDGDATACQSRLNQGGWGTAVIGNDGNQDIPNRSVKIVNNVIYNPTGYESEWQHFAIYDPRSTSNSSNIPSPSRTDTDLVIQGNIIWNGDSSKPLGISAEACTTSNPTCNEAQLSGNNTINSGAVPFFRNVSAFDFRPIANGAIMNSSSYPISNFSNVGRPASIPSPNGILDNSIRRDYSAANRLSSGPPGAFASSTSPNQRMDYVRYICASSSDAAKSVCFWKGSTCTYGQIGLTCSSGGTCYQVSC